MGTCSSSVATDDADGPARHRPHRTGSAHRPGRGPRWAPRNDAPWPAPLGLVDLGEWRQAVPAADGVEAPAAGTTVLSHTASERGGPEPPRSNVCSMIRMYTGPATPRQPPRLPVHGRASYRSSHAPHPCRQRAGEPVGRAGRRRAARARRPGRASGSCPMPPAPPAPPPTRSGSTWPRSPTPWSSGPIPSTATSGPCSSSPPARTGSTRPSSPTWSASRRSRTADAEFVRTRTGYAIGGVPPLAHLEPPLTVVDVVPEPLRDDLGGGGPPAHGVPHVVRRAAAPHRRHARRGGLSGGEWSPRRHACYGRRGCTAVPRTSMNARIQAGSFHEHGFCPAGGVVKQPGVHTWWSLTARRKEFSHGTRHREVVQR